MESETLKATDEYSAARATHPRVSLADMETKIIRQFYLNGGDAALVFDQHTARNGPLDDEIKSLEALTICILVMKNGFTVIGKSAPASPENFDREKGERFAYEDAIKQLWPLEGYALRDKLSA